MKNTVDVGSPTVIKFSRTPPWSLQKAQVAIAPVHDGQTSAVSSDDARPIENLGTAYGIPSDVDPKDFAEENNCLWARPINPNRDLAQPYTIFVALFDHVPRMVTVAGFLRIPMKGYLPRPMRCRNCQAFGHTTARCRNTPMSDFCGIRGHTESGCNLRDQNGREKYANCKGPHKASSTLCSKYLENCAIIKLAHESSPPLSFKQAQQQYAAYKRDHPQQFSEPSQRPQRQRRQPTMKLR